MQRQEKFGKVHFVLVALTLAFLGGLAALAIREGGAAAEGTYRVETERGLPAESAEAGIAETRSAETGTAAGEAVDINTATAEELQELMGIGPVLSQAIVDYRAEYGPFQSVDELLAVNGIGEAKLDGIRDEVTVNGG